MVVRSKRGVLLLQAVLLFALAAMVGWAVETWHLLPMSRLSDRWGFPVALSFFAVVGLVIAVILAKDDWNHRVTFERDHLRIEDALGTTRVGYDDIAEAKIIRMHGVGIKLKPGSHWLASFEGSQAAREKKAKLSAIIQRAYGCELSFSGKILDVGVDRFIEELRSRLRAASGVDPS